MRIRKWMKDRHYNVQDDKQNTNSVADMTSWNETCDGM